MKKILKSALLLTMGLALLAACSDDNDSNPTVQRPTTFVVNTPVLTNAQVDLANSEVLQLTCSQPDYGFPVRTAYTVDVATTADMKDAVPFGETFYSTTINLDAATLAAMLTTIETEKGKTEADFPMLLPVYLRVNACMVDGLNNPVADMGITSNVVAFNKVRLLYSLPPVTTPENIYLVGSFCGWDWGKSLAMVPCYDGPNVFWHMVYIDGSGIKFNTVTAWDGGEKGFAGINSVSGDLAAQIQDSGDGNIASSTPGWYLMVVTCSVVGRDIIYDVQFNEPNVWLMGSVTPTGGWDELMEGCKFEVPATADGSFVSPAFANNAADDSGVRAYVKVPGFDWWKTEFMVFNKQIIYRGAGGDQDRVGGSAGQRLYLNFTNETGEIK
jgi:hypothetical protein